MDKNKISIRNAVIFVALIVLTIVIGAVIQHKQNKYNKFFVERITTQENTAQAVEDVYLIDINTDDATELQKLDGIGEKTALRIIEYRKKNGDFEVIEDIMKVDGMGKKKFDDIKDKICVLEKTSEN